MPEFYELHPPPIPERWSWLALDYEESVVVPGLECDVCRRGAGVFRGEVIRANLHDPGLVAMLRERPWRPRGEHEPLMAKLGAVLEAQLGYVPPLRGGIRIGPARVKLSGTRLPDISIRQTAIVKRRVVDLLREHNVTGFDAFPVEVTRVLRKPKGKPLVIPELWELDIPGQAALSPEAGALRDPDCEACGRRGSIGLPDSIIIDESTWDGRDLFRLEGRSWILTTERVADLLRETKLTGFTLKPAHECVIT